MLVCDLVLVIWNLLVTLQAFDRLGAHDQLLLREHALEPGAKGLPPRAVEAIDHDFVDDDIVPCRLPAILAPQSLGGRTRVRGETPEARRELVANARVVRGRERAPGIVIDGQQQLNEVHVASSIRLAGCAECRNNPRHAPSVRSSPYPPAALAAVGRLTSSRVPAPGTHRQERGIDTPLVRKLK